MVACAAALGLLHLAAGDAHGQGSPAPSASGSALSSASASSAGALPSASATPTASAGDEAEAKRLFLAGNAAYRQGDYVGAIAAFRAAYAKNPRPGLGFSLAQALRKQYVVSEDVSLLSEAAGLYRRYVSEVKRGERVPDAVSALAEIDPILAQKRPSAATSAPTAVTTRVAIATQLEEGVSVSVDGQPAVASSVVELTPGRHTLTISADGYLEERRVVDAPEGSFQSIDVPLRERPASLTVSLAAAADVAIDGRVVAQTPLRAPLDVPSGRHVITVLRNGHLAHTSELSLARGQAITLSPLLVETTQRRASVGLFVAAGAAAIAGGVLTGLTFMEQNEARSVLGQTSGGGLTLSDLERYDQAVERRDAFRTSAIAAFGLTGVLVATGGLLFGLDRPSAQGAGPTAKRGWPLTVTAGLGALSVRGSF